MKKIILSILLVAFWAVGNMNAQQILIGKELSKEQTKELHRATIEGMVSFVESVRPFYEEGDSYEQFKLKVLIGSGDVNLRTALPTLPPQGEAMLKKAYGYLSSNASSRNIALQDDGKTFADAYLYTLKYERDNSKSSISGNIALFGGNKSQLENNPLESQTRKKCKWYQLFCHLGNIFGEEGGSAITNAVVTVIIAALEAMVMK